METWQVIFRNLYTGFLLRDLAGKIIPGIFLLFSIAAMFRPPRDLIQGLRKDVPLFIVIFVAGLAWIVTLGTQSLAEGLGIWHYFPIEPPAGTAPAPPVGFWSNLAFGGDEAGFNRDTAQIDKFQLGASEDQKQQYERFVVIKEGCGNLFVAGLLATPAWICILFVHRQPDRKKPSDKSWSWRIGPSSPPVLCAAYFLLIMIGLHRMNAQHVRRQFNYTRIVIENRGQSAKDAAASRSGWTTT
jgi:hypothetical protein